MIRVIPRDLFNEANLLKCYGQLYLQLEKLNPPDVDLDHDGGCFDVQQGTEDGSTWIENIQLWVDGDLCRLFRPMNSREPWPLYALFDSEEFPVFDDSGDFSVEMLDFLKGTP